MKFDVGHGLKKLRESHPARGAWIEISQFYNPYGAATVAPRKGCVD